MNIICCVILPVLLLTACLKEPIVLSPQQVAMLHERDLCAYRNQRLAPYTQSLIDGEILRRQVDCHPHHQECASYGLRKGTGDYAGCRLKLKEQDQHYMLNQQMMNQYQQMHDDRLRYEQQQRALIQRNSDMHHHEHNK